MDVSHRAPSTLGVSSAEKSLNAEYKTIKAGNKKMRLQLGSHSRFWVAAENTQGMWAITITWKKFLGKVEVPLEDGSSVLLSRTGFEKRLHMKTTDIQKLAEAGQLTLSFLDQRVKQLSLSLLAYEQISSKNHHKLTPSQLMKITQVASEQMITSKTPREGKIIAVDNFSFVARLSKKGALKLYRINRELGKGNCGAVFVAEYLHKSEEKAWKVARTADGKNLDQAKQAIRNEYQMLSDIHASGKVLGIQEKPTLMVNMTPQNDAPVVGFFGKKYDRNYFNDIHHGGYASTETRLAELYQLLFGLKHLEEKGILHGDIKLENIFCKAVTIKSVGPCTSVYLADFGGAKKSKEASSATGMLPSLHTPVYRSGVDQELLNDFIKGNQQAQANELLHKMDVFALGIVFYEVLTGGTYPFRTMSGKSINEENNYLDIFSKDLKALNLCSAPPEIKDLIKKMLDNDYQKRPSAKDAFQHFEKFLDETTDRSLVHKIYTHRNESTKPKKM